MILTYSTKNHSAFGVSDSNCSLHCFFPFLNLGFHDITGIQPLNSTMIEGNSRLPDDDDSLHDVSGSNETLKN